MKHFKLKARMYRNEDNGQNQGDNGGGNGNNENNGDPNLPSHDSLWDANPDDKGNANNSDDGQQTQTTDGNTAFQQHVDSLDFNAGIDPNAVMQAMRDGDPEALTAAFNKIGANAYRNAIVDANKIMGQKVEAMAKTVKDDVSSANASGELVKEMHNQLSFTKSPAFAPVAKLVLTQFIEKGSSPQDAIKQVGEYFKNLSGEVAKLNPSAPNRRPTGGFGGGSNNGGGNTDEGGEEDWMEFLGAPSS